MLQTDINRIKRFAKGGDLEKFWGAYQADPNQLFEHEGHLAPQKGLFNNFAWQGPADAYKIVPTPKKTFVQVGTRRSIFDKSKIITFCIQSDTTEELMKLRENTDFYNAADGKMTWHPIQSIEIPNE